MRMSKHKANASYAKLSAMSKECALIDIITKEKTEKETECE